MRIEIFQRWSWRQFRRLWYFRIKASNGEIVAQSESYVSKQGVSSTAILLIQTMSSAVIVDV